MTDQDFTKRLTIIVRNDLEGWQATNAIAHIAAYIGNKLEGSFGTGEVFTTSDGVAYPRNSQYPFIIKSAGSSKELHDVFDAARAEGLFHIGFIREMIDTTDDTEIETILASKSSDDIEFLGLGVFGESEQIKTLTKKFSLWK